MARQLNHAGQALIEWAILIAWLYLGLFAAIVAYGQTFVTRQELILAAREGALLYSSGRLTSAEVKQRLQRSLRQGSPSLRIAFGDIYVGRSADTQAKRFELDLVTLRYPRSQLMLRFCPKRLAHLKYLEESCVIKHAPAYGPIGSPVGIHYGRPVDW